LTQRTVKVAVLGSGPSGVYAVNSLLGQDKFPVTVDVFDRLPTPYGLVRYGVAPDHPNIKSVTSVLHRVLEDERVRFLGCVEFGTDVSRADLLTHYDAIVYAMGASVDRKLGIPGEDLPGSHSATEFVAWYSGHPDAKQPFRLDELKAVAVIGVGNVAVDVARILAKTPQDLAQTDLPNAVLDILEHSTVRDIHMIGRRGPEHAKFTTKELRELGALVNATVHVVPEEIAAADNAELDKMSANNMKVLRTWAADPTSEEKPRRIFLRFGLRPVAIEGTERVEGLRCELTAIQPDGSVAGTGEYETFPVECVLRAAGYRSLPLPDVPFDPERGVVRNMAGRVVDDAGALLPGEYVVGWLKRGPTGVIGTNKHDAIETVDALIEDVVAAGLGNGPERPDIAPELAARKVDVVDFGGWLRIDAEEQRRGAEQDRERAKLHEWETLRAFGNGRAE
jgi:ferredoxin--NADP+ reductase